MYKRKNLNTLKNNQTLWRRFSIIDSVANYLRAHQTFMSDLTIFAMRPQSYIKCKRNVMEDCR